MSIANVILKRMGVISLAVMVLSGCMQPKSGNFDENVKDMNASLRADVAAQKRVVQQSKNLSLPSSVTSKMLPSAAALPGEKQGVAAARFDVSVNNIDAKEFFAGLATGSSCSIIVSPDVTGNVSLSLKQVTLSEVLDAVANLYGYRYEKTAYGYNIYPKELETRIFMVNKLALERSLQTNTQLNNSGGDLTTATSSNGTSTSTSPSTVTLQASQKEAFWQNLQATIFALIGGKKDGVDSPMVQITEETGMIVVRAYPKDMQLVENYLAQTQSILGRQVVIEAEILDVELSSSYAAGIDWGILTAGGTTVGATPEKLIGDTSSSAVNLIGNVYSLSLSGDNNNFQYAVNLLASQGKVSVLSKPRVAAVNNQSAIIKVGTDNYYVTNVQSQITTGTDTSSSTTSTINLQAFFSGISLYITPQITEDGEVNLHIHPAVSRVTENNLQVTVDGQNSTLPVAQSVLRETDTVVRAKNGQVLILGGLIQANSEDVNSGLPLDQKYSDNLGGLASSKKSDAVKTELVILLRPLIVEDQSMRKDLDLTAKKLFTEKSNQRFFDNAYRD